MKTSVNIAVHKASKRVETLERIVEILKPQTDMINIHWNDFSKEEIPKWAKQKFVTNSYGVDFSDLGKFAFLEFVKEAKYYLTLDSDILPPPNYVAEMKRQIDKHKCVIAYHGRVLNPKERDRFYKGKHQFFKFNADLNQDIEIDVPGTGVMGFRTDNFCPTNLHLLHIEKMADLVFAKYAKIHGIKIICPKHSRVWIKSVHLKGIWDEFNRKGASEKKQVYLMNEIQDLCQTKK